MCGMCKDGNVKKLKVRRWYCAVDDVLLSPRYYMGIEYYSSLIKPTSRTYKGRKGAPDYHACMVYSEV